MNRAALVAILLVVVIGGAAAWMLRNGANKDQLELGGYFEAEQIQVGSKLGGRVTHVLVEEGDPVEAGQTIVAFETDEVKAQLEEAKFEKAQAAAKLAELREGTREEEKEQARARVANLREKLKMFESGSREQEIEQTKAIFERSKADAENAQTNYERQVALFERKAAASEAVDNARKTMEMSIRLMEADKQKYELVRAGFREEEVAMVKHELEEAEAARDLAEHGPRPTEIRQAEAAVDAATARVRRLQILYEEATVKAPMRCVVEAFFKSSGLQPGDLVAPGAPLATLVRTDQLWVRAFVPETDLGFVHVDQIVRVKVDSFPDRSFGGTVLRINRVAEFTPRNVQTFKERQDMLFGIKVRVAEEDQDSDQAKEEVKLLRPGMAATVYVPKRVERLNR